MAHRDPLVAQLMRLARLLLTDFAIDDVLADVCSAATELIAIHSAGVTRIEADELRAMGCTDPATGRLQEVQAALRSGPSTLVLGPDQPLQVDVSAQRDLWPCYAVEAEAIGIRRVVVLPLWGRERLWGVLELYLSEDRWLSETEAETAQVLAEAATAYVLTAQDRGDAAQAKEQLRTQLLHDPLTGLPNRLLLADRLEHALNLNIRPARSLAVLFLDLDDFKRVNDRYGHQTGDHLLAEVARRLVSALRSSDTVARLSGDEFVVVCENFDDRPLDDAADLTAVGQRVLDALRAPMEIDGAHISLRASVGAVWARGSDGSAGEVLDRADSVMYVAKRSGGNRVVASDGPLGRLRA